MMESINFMGNDFQNKKYLLKIIDLSKIKYLTEIEI